MLKLYEKKVVETNHLMMQLDQQVYNEILLKIIEIIQLCWSPDMIGIGLTPRFEKHVQFNKPQNR